MQVYLSTSHGRHAHTYRYRYRTVPYHMPYHPYSEWCSVHSMDCYHSPWGKTLHEQVLWSSSAVTLNNQPLDYCRSEDSEESPSLDLAMGVLLLVLHSSVVLHFPLLFCIFDSLHSLFSVLFQQPEIYLNLWAILSCDLHSLWCCMPLRWTHHGVGCFSSMVSLFV